MNYERLYAYRFRDVDQRAREDVWREIARYVYDAIGRPHRVLDAAAGRREFINAIPAAERWAIDAVDYGEAAVAPGTTIVTGDVMDATLPSGYFDGVFVSNFLEHLPAQEAVAQFLERMYDSMETGGRIAIVGPNFRYCAAEYFDCADHTVVLTHVAVAEHLYAAGFSVGRVTPRFLPYSFRGVLPPSPTLTRYYLKLPLAWRFLGKQFFVVAAK